VQGGKIKKILLYENKSTSNKNEFLAILYAYRIFKEEIKKGKNIFSDSKFAIDKTKKLYMIEAKKVKAHSGNLWNTIADTLMKNIVLFKNLKNQKNYSTRLEFLNLSLWQL
jgi:ribonuclease HI